MKPARSWMTNSQQSFGSVATNNAKPVRKLPWFWALMIISTAVLFDCWYNERIWSMNFGVRASVSKAPVNRTPRVEQRSKLAVGQQLMLDLAECPAEILNKEERLVHVANVIAAELEVDVARMDLTELDPVGYGLVANWGDSHMTIHTWPESGDALINILIADEENDENLRELLPLIAKLLEGNLKASTFSIIPRGRDVDVFDNEAYSPAEIMTRHQYKLMISEVQSPFQNVAIWDHHDEMDDSTDKEMTRSLFLDGVMQSSIADEYLYHETLVQPAFIASAVPPKRVLIVGGGEGGTLRETLKWKSVEETVMVDLDAQVVKSSREFLPTYSNCTGFGTPNCFDDPRTKLFTTDFFKWFDDHIGDDICETRHKKKHLLFDVIILDLLDTEELPTGVAWAEYLYSKLFFERIACSATDLGVVISNFGEAPESPYEPEYLENIYPETATVDPISPTGELVSRTKMFLRKISQLRSFSGQFKDFRVYDAYVPAFRAPWAFAMGIVPRFSKESEDKTKLGVSYFDGTNVQVHHKLRHGLIDPNALQHYHGGIQQIYQQPFADWIGVFCEEPAYNDTCSLSDRFFDDETSLWKVEKTEGGTKKVAALADMKKGAILGAWDLVFPNADKIIDSMQTSCEPNTGLLKDNVIGASDRMWNPALQQIEAQVDTSIVLLRDVKAGEALTKKGEKC